MATTQIQTYDNKQHDISDLILLNKEEVGKFLLRLTIGGLMLFHGVNKLMYGTEQIQGMLQSVGLPGFFSFGVILGEVIGPLMMILGFKTRIGAALVAFDMVMAIILVHSAQLVQVNEGGGWMLELNAFYLFGSIAVLFLGSGRFGISHGHGSLD